MSLSQIESFSQFRRRLRREAKAAEAAQVEIQRLAAIEAEKKHTKDARRAALHAEYREYWHQQMNAGSPDSEIVSFREWCSFSPVTRANVLDAIRKNPDGRITGLKGI